MDKMLELIDRLDQDPDLEILRIKPRFGGPKNLNDIKINFEFEGMMICELILKYSPKYEFEFL